jgi:hypothetical protein
MRDGQAHRKRFFIVGSFSGVRARLTPQKSTEREKLLTKFAKYKQDATRMADTKQLIDTSRMDSPLLYYPEKSGEVAYFRPGSIIISAEVTCFVTPNSQP